MVRFYKDSGWQKNVHGINWGVMGKLVRNVSSKLGNEKISCELTEIHLDCSVSQTRIGRYHWLLKKLREELKEIGLSYLYGVFHLKENCKEKFENSNILNKNSPEQAQFIADLISMLRKLSIPSNLDIKYNGFDEHLEYFTCSDMRSVTSERDFYWWFSHIKSGPNDTLPVNCSNIQEIISKKSLKLKKYKNNYSQNWLIIYSSDRSLKDSYIIPGIWDMEDVSSNDEIHLISEDFDKVYFLSTWCKPVLLCRS